MTVILGKHKIFYAAVPKVACTSLKKAFFEVENGFAFRDYRASGRFRHIHNAAYPTLLFDDHQQKNNKDLWRATFVRDPIARLLSAYSNRVLHHNELSEQAAGAKLDALGLAPRPDLETFVDNLTDYQKAHPSIWHHTRRAVAFLGTNPDYYSRIYTLSEMKTFEADIEERSGTKMTVGREQTGGKKFKVEDLSKKSVEKLKKFYAEDYKTYGAYF